MKHKIRNRIFRVVIYLMLTAGVGLIIYPSVSSWLVENTARSEINRYNTRVKEQDPDSLRRMRQEAVSFNEELQKEGVSKVSYSDLLAVTDAIAYLEIPRLSVYLPVYHGLDEKNMEKGIGHMPDTSLPVGGESTHCVLSGHSGLPSARLLTGLDQMEKGDLFYIHVLDDTLAYKVDQVKTVLPDDTEDIQIVPGKDYVTLVTCVPYGVNTHRLLVRGERTQYSPAEISLVNDDQGEKTAVPEKVVILLAVASGILWLAVLMMIIFCPGRKQKRKRGLIEHDEEKNP